MKIDYIKNQIKVAGMVIACTSLCSCNSEIEDGTTDIDSWPKFMPVKMLLIRTS